MKIGSLFSGYGGLEMGVQSVISGEVAWHVEFDPAPSRILEHRYLGVPNYGDITAVDWSAVEPVDVLTGGFPCQDVSLAGLRRGLKEGTRSGLWSEFARAIGHLRPGLVVIENVRGLLSAVAAGPVESDPWSVGDGAVRPSLRALGAVLGDLADLGYDARWGGFRAADAGAPHGRFRVFIVAHPSGQRWGQGWTARDHSAPANPTGRGCDGRSQVEVWQPIERATATRPGGADWGPYGGAIGRWERSLGRVAPGPTEPTGKGGAQRLSPAFVEWMMGLPAGWLTAPEIGLTRAQQLKALGNGVVPQQAALAVRTLLEAEAVAA